MTSDKESCIPEDGEECCFFVPYTILKTIARIITLVFVIFAIFVFIVWLCLRPISKPRFVLEDASIYSFNITSPYRLSSNLQITLSAENLNPKISIYFDTVNAYASYRSQQISLPTSLPSAFVGHTDQTLWTPIMYGNSVPIAPFFGDAFVQDQKAGICLIHFKVSGKIRFKVGTWISWPYILEVTCPAYASFGKTDNNNAIMVGALSQFRLLTRCNVELFKA